MDPAPRLLVVMDPIDAIDPRKDSTLAMLLGAQRREWSVQYAEMGEIWLRDGAACGRVTDLRVTDELAHWYDFGSSADVSLGDFDVTLQRKDPPFDLECIYASYFLERAELQGALVVNRPRSLRDANEKVFVSWFPEALLRWSNEGRVIPVWRRPSGQIALASSSKAAAIRRHSRRASTPSS